MMQTIPLPIHIEFTIQDIRKCCCTSTGISVEWMARVRTSEGRHDKLGLTHEGDLGGTSYRGSPKTVGLVE